MTISSEEKEILIRAIDVLTMENLRLIRENEILNITNQTLMKQTHKKAKRKSGKNSENVWTKGVNYLQREGFWKTVKKIISKLTN